MADNIKYILNNEIVSDVSTRLYIRHSPNCMSLKHFHRNIELFGVKEGEVEVTIADKKRVLRAGEIVSINPYEAHGYDSHGEIDVYIASIGSLYMSNFESIYKGGRLPCFLTDVEYNKILFDKMNAACQLSDDTSLSLRKFAIVNDLLAAIVDRYGVIATDSDVTTDNLAENVVQYIYNHYADELSLSSLADKFGVSPTSLSKKLSPYIGKDLRAFINDVRAIKVQYILNDPSTRDLPLKDIAFRCGFKNPETFYRVYARNFGGGGKGTPDNLQDNPSGKSKAEC